MSSAPTPHTAALFQALRATVTGRERNGEVWTSCPECGKDRGKSKPSHFSFSMKGAHCFACGYGASLMALAEHYGTRTDVLTNVPERPVAPPKPRAWQSNPQSYLDGYCAAWDRLERWQAYRPFTLDTIARYRLGVGRLPSSQCQHPRLIYPLFQDDQIVGFRGRALGCDCPKWLTCGGATTVLWGLEQVRPGVPLIVCENPVDAMLAMQLEDVSAVAGTAGCGTWRPVWTAALAALKPSRVVVWMDHDLVGNGHPNHCPTCREAAREWQAKHPTGRLPEPNGPRIARELRTAGLATTCYDWPKAAPHKYDLGAALMQQNEEVNA